MPLNTDQLLVVFPHPVLTKIVGKPTLESINLQKSEPNENLAFVKSNLGDGLTGLMVISMKPVNPSPMLDLIEARFPLCSLCWIVRLSRLGSPTILVRTGRGKTAKSWLAFSGIG